MAKGKQGVGVQNRPLYSRISFLHQAATHLALLKQPTEETGSATAVPDAEQAPAPLEGMARRLATDLRSVSLKTRIRLSPAVKQYVCKYCDTVLLEGQSCSSFVENKSKGCKKPWADVLVRKCNTCGKEKRFPISAPRTKRKTLREPESTKSTKEPEKTG